MASALLHYEAERFRRLAAGIVDLDLRHRLLAIAARLEAQAGDEEASVNDDLPPLHPETCDIA
jgi:hypothetical protein